MTARWYLVQTRARQEPRASQNLIRQGYDVFLPTELRMSARARRRAPVEAAFFPGYLFVRLDLERQSWRSINSTFGVSRIVSVDHAPTPVREDIVEALIASRDADGHVVVRDAFTEGDRVRVRTGPFEGFVGQIAALRPHDRLRVLLEFMNQSTPVEVLAHACTKMSAQDWPAPTHGSA